MSMQHLQWPMAVLCKAIHYKNLTGASQHIGLSQPQLSRLISTLEKDLDLILLDRTSKRKAEWTLAAHDLAKIYQQFTRKLQFSIQELQQNSQPKHIHIGTLEGLSTIAKQFAKKVLDNTSVQTVELDVFDQNEIEAKFAGTEIDLVFSSRIPGKRKLKNFLEIGYQTLEAVSSNSQYQVLSQFEYGQYKNKKQGEDDKKLVSNSLQIRRNWLQSFGGTGQLPSELTNKKKSTHLPVLLLASDQIHPDIWNQAISLKKELSR